MQEAYDRSQQEVRASHILVKVDEDASPADTLAAWKRITALRARVEGGEDFAKVAQGPGGSDDPSAKSNGGDLGYFSVLQMVYPFENAAFNTPVGQISQPIRTKFGYHIIKVVDKRPAHGDITVAHIMVRSTPEDSPEKQAEAEKRAEEAYGRIKSGELTFADAALKFSDDAATNAKGGELAPFSTGKMIPEFEAKAFSLQNDGDIAPPFKTPYGWHIVKRISYKAPATFEEAKADLKAKIARDSRAEITRKKFLNDLRGEYHYKENAKNITAVSKVLDNTIFEKGTLIMDTLLRKDCTEGRVMRNGLEYDRAISTVIKDGKGTNPRARGKDDVEPLPTDTVVVRDAQVGWVNDKAKTSKLNKPVFSIDGKEYTQADLLDYIDMRQRREPAQPMEAYVKDRYDQFVDDKLLAYEDSRLEEKYPEFRMLMKEYRDGILLFELTDEKVWSKAVKDTTGLEGYYAEHKFDFMYPVRYDVDIYSCKTPEVAKQVRTLVKKGKEGKELLNIVNKSDSTALSIDAGVFTPEERPILKGVSLPGLTADVQMDGKTQFANLLQVVQPSPKPLDEARGLVTAAYQDQLEKDWIKELRAKYQVKVEQDVLYSIK
jgi:peptidyl-prolyl cis-trans isomerase SurA